jgi:oxygen-independent coproporphyrinogen III oxidase
LAGLYFHIPFCKQSCIYCNFYFKNGRKYAPEFIDSLLREIDIKLNKNTEFVETVYFGGGTPSFLEEQDLTAIFERLKSFVDVSSLKELTFEANPDDMSFEKLQFWKSIGITRLSVGVQSFFDEHLKWMNRAHNTVEAHQALTNAGDLGFDLSLDLIFGIPGSSQQQWQYNMEKALSYNIQHLSCYGLTLEEKTPWSKLIATKNYQKPDDTMASEQFEMAMSFLSRNGWQQYEISNYSLPGKEAIHNTSYWKSQPYIGFGPSAHSYDGTYRSWNVADLRAYSESILKGELPETKELLSHEDKYNEYVMTSLRTMWGLDTQHLQTFGLPLEGFQTKIQEFIQNGLVRSNQSVITLTDKGKLYADAIASDLFY